MYEQIRYEVENSVATLTLSRPERLNAWTEQMGQEIMHALASAERDAGVVAIIMTGAGRGFCSGADLSTLSAISHGKASAGQVAEPTEERPGDPSMGPSFRGPFSYPMSILKPIIGAINGPCVGLGLAIALSCDIRFASDRATFSTAFARRGLVAEWGVSWTLPRIVGAAHAMDLLLSARAVGPEEAQRMGLVNRVVPHEDFTRVVREYAEDIATHCAPESLAVIKRDVLQHLSTTLQQAEQDTLRHMTESFSRADFREGLASLAEKRPPRFGRMGSQAKVNR